MDKTFKSNFLEGKTALITGGATGICYTIAETYLKFGCKVCIMSRKEKIINEAIISLKQSSKNENCYGFPCDVRKYDDIVKAVDYFLSKVQKIDILINGAAGNFISFFETLSPNGFKTVIDIDLIGTFQVSKVVYEKSMKLQGSGNIINISAYLYGSLMQIHAGSAKAGVDNITQTLAVELGPKNIRVNGIAPGSIENTEGLQRLAPQDTDIKDKILQYFPIHRYGRKQDIADCALFLASDASSYITGVTILVDGGKKLTLPIGRLLSNQVMQQWKPKL